MTSLHKEEPCNWESERHTTKRRRLQLVMMEGVRNAIWILTAASGTARRQPVTGKCIRFLRSTCGILPFHPTMFDHRGSSATGRNHSRRPSDVGVCTLMTPWRLSCFSTEKTGHAIQCCQRALKASLSPLSQGGAVLDVRIFAKRCRRPHSSPAQHSMGVRLSNECGASADLRSVSGLPPECNGQSVDMGSDQAHKFPI